MELEKKNTREARPYKALSSADLCLTFVMTTYMFPYYVPQTNQSKYNFIQLKRERPVSNFQTSTRASIKRTCTNAHAQFISILKSHLVQPNAASQAATSLSMNAVITL